MEENVTDKEASIKISTIPEIRANWKFANNGPSAHVRDDVYSWAIAYAEMLMDTVDRLQEQLDSVTDQEPAWINEFGFK